MPRKTAANDDISAPGKPQPKIPERATYRTLDQLHDALLDASSHEATRAVWRNAADSAMFAVRKHRPAECLTCTGRK